MGTAASKVKLDKTSLREKITKTGISGLDEILGGGLPRNKIIMLVGRPGCGKSVLSMEFILRGVETYNEPGVYCSFEETREDLFDNAGSFGWDLERLNKQNKVCISAFDIQSDQNVEVGEFSLEGVFLRIELAIKRVKARRIVLDGLNNLISGFSNEKLVRLEVIRLFRWLKEKDLTVMVTGERGVSTWTKHGFEEYLCDGLILLDSDTEKSFTTRYLQIIKCRGINHGTDTYPFLIGRQGIEIVPILSADFNYDIREGEYVSSGVKDVDAMMETSGFIRGSTVLITGTSGTGKSTLSSAFVESACKQGRKAIFFAFEESREQVIRNMKSVGIDLQKWLDNGRLLILSTRSTVSGLEGHLITIRNRVIEHRPSVVVIDPITAFRPVAPVNQIKLMLIRINDFLRSMGVTTLLTSLADGRVSDELADIPMSSLADTWITVRIQEYNNEKYNLLEIQKSRGMQHNKQRKELILSKDGIRLEDLYMGPNGLVAGAAKIQQQKEEQKAMLKRQLEASKLAEILKMKEDRLKHKLREVQFEARGEIRETQAALENLQEQIRLEAEKRKSIESAFATSESK